MRKIQFLTFAMLAAVLVQAQVVTKTIRRKTCYTTTYLQQLQKNNPGIETTADFENWMKAKVQQKRSDPSQNSITNYAPLPIIFHVLHTGQTEGSGYNIPQARIIAQVVQLNKDYANQSGSPYAVASTTGLQFCLAATNPSGATLAQPGIDRINVSGKSYGKPPYLVDSFDTKVKPATIWDPSKYINVWVTEFDVSEGILGYSTFPSTSTLAGLDELETNTRAGVGIDYTTIGSVGTGSVACASSTYNNGRTLTHELGHYFGLRHIWGDATCGNDYCDDTPVQTDANFGAPVHPKANSCGTADEMFENYMDYCDDKILNTFTLNQVERMQVVMLNSLRRKTLPASTAGCGNSTSGNNKIGFFPCDGKLNVSEKSSAATCPLYTDVKLYLSIEDKATGTATLNINTSGTATKGVDYDILTPVINIATGDAYKQVTVRIYDDAAKEADETISISYTITGAGVTANASLAQTFVITILDNDNITVGQNTKTIFSENFGTSGNSLPAGWATLTTNQYPDPKNKFLVGGNGGVGFSGQSLYISNNTTTRSLAYSIGTASVSYVQTPVIDASGAGSLTLSFKYKVSGEQDDDGVYDFGLVQSSLATDRFGISTIPGTKELVGNYNSTTGTMSTVNTTLTTPLPATLAGNKFYLNFYWENDDNTGAQPPLVVDDILITSKPTGVESTLNHGKAIGILANDTNYIVSKDDGQIIAAIAKCSENISCLNGMIQQEGNGQVDVATNSGTFKRSQKVVKLSPAAASNATYTLTLYYTTAELAAWPDITTLKVMKVQDGVSLGGTLNGSNAVILTPVVADNRTADGYASFTVNATGFSQFFLVEASTTLPVQLISFNAALVNSGASLIWNTSNETANKGFDVQRSSDGTNFTTIGFVAGKNQASTTNYSYFDNTIQQGITYYYRLQQVDVNGKTSFSAVRSLRLDGNGITLLVYPNPAKTVAHVVTGKIMVASVSLLGVNGEKVWEMPKQTISSSGFDVPLEKLPAGVYMLWIQDDKTRRNVKLVKE